MLGILILQKNIQKKFKKIDKQIVKQLNYDKIEFPVQEKDFNKIEMMNNVCINVFDNMIKMIIILITCTSKILTDLCFTKQKIKIKSGFVEVIYSVLVVKVC